MTIRAVKMIGVLLAGALLLAACGTTTPPTYGGGDNGSSSSTSTTAPTSSTGATNSAMGVATKFAEVNWSSSPKWPGPNYVYTLERPYLTPAMNASDAARAARLLPASVTTKWDEDVKYGIGTYADVSQAWIVTDAGVTSSKCVVELDLSIGTTQDGVKSPTEGETYEYAFTMQRIDGKWLVASPPEEPQ